MGNQETKTRHARGLRDIYFIDPEDEEQKDIIENAKRKLEVQMDAAVPCMKGTKGPVRFQETEVKSDASNTFPKTKHPCIVEAHAYTRQRLELSLLKITKIISQVRDTTRCHITSWYTSLFLCRRR